MKVGFAGSGNMAAAIARGWDLVGGPDEMLFTDSGSGRAAALAEETGGERIGSLQALSASSDILVLAVKPAALDAVSEPLRRFRGPVISVLGATPVVAVEQALPEAAVLRTMPNVGTELGRGVICHAPARDPEAVAPALELLARIALLVELPEEQLDAATAVMGCSLAWIALACGAISDAGAEAGLDPELSAKLIARSAAVTGELLLRHDADSLIKAVASPGGSTEAGLDELGERDVAEAYAAAVRASLERMAGEPVIAAAIDRVDVAEYVGAIFTIYLIMIFARIAISWVVMFRGSLPYYTPLRVVTDFIEQSVDPYLNLFRRLIPPIGGGRMGLDLSPIIGVFALLIVQGILVNLIEG